jgi:hypothetical protein
MQSRRDFLKKGLYVAPLILTVAVKPAYACPTYKPSDSLPPRDITHR